MNIKLKQLTLKNFKGIKGLTISFNETTNISGENATGKTTVFDSFCWLLFGKDSKGKTNFEIQTLDESNNVIHGLEHQVIGILEIDGVEKILSKTYKENWVKKRGESERELKGCSTDYEINEVPVKQKEYQAAISDLINEDLFKMVTNPLFFPGMNWQEQRKILLDITGEPEEESVINYNIRLSPLKSLLTDGIDNFNKRVKASIAKLKDQAKSIPYRIDECNNSIVEVDTEALEFQKRGIQGSINSIDEQITDSSKANEEKLKIQDKLYELKDQQRKLQISATEQADKPLIEIKNQIQSIESQIRKYAYEVNEKEEKKGRLTKEIAAYKEATDKNKTTLEDLTTQWYKERDTLFEFDMTQSMCPTCGREYEIERLEEIRANAEGFFNEMKAKKLESITSRGKGIKKINEELGNDIKSCEETIASLKIEVETINGNIDDCKAELFDLEKQKAEFNNTTELLVPGYEELEKEITLLQFNLEGFKSKDNTELKVKKKELQDKLETINKQLGSKDNNSKLKARIKELEAEEKQLNVKMAELEGQLYLGEEYIRTKVELLEGEINRKFNGAVAFKLFNQQVNGGLSECCEALVNGVPFGNVNTAGQINAGLSIIKTLTEHYGVSAPIFIDNRESVNTLIDFEGQVINLKVSKDKKLKVEVQE